MPSAKELLEEALRSIDWNSNRDAFLGDEGTTSEIASSSLRIARWVRQLNAADKGNPALTFLNEAQVSTHYVAALAAIALYKPAASAMRTMLESVLYYTYFRTHPSELATLARDDTYFVLKSDVIEYHKRHTKDFRRLQNALNLLSMLDKWYGDVSAIIHGQIPGRWVKHVALKDIRPDADAVNLLRREFKQGEEIVNRLLLCTVAHDLWADFDTRAKKAFLAGLSGEMKDALQLDPA